MFQVARVLLETASRTLSRAWCSASDTHVFPGGLDRQILWKHLADLLVKLGGGSRVMKSIEKSIDITTHNTHINIYTHIYVSIYIYICKCIRIHSVMSGFAKKIPPESWDHPSSAAEAAPP